MENLRIFQMAYMLLFLKTKKKEYIKEPYLY